MPAFTPAAVVGLLVCAGRVGVLPVHTWTLQVALTELESRVDETLPLGQVLRRWPRHVGPAGREFLGVDAMLRQLVRTGHLRPEGSGWAAGYRVDEEWMEMSERLMPLLERSERVAIRRGGQRLFACATTLSKNARASAPQGSPTI